VDTLSIAIFAVLSGLFVGLLGGYLVRRLIAGSRYRSAVDEATRVHEEAKEAVDEATRLQEEAKEAVDEATRVQEEAKEKERILLLEAKEEAIRIRSAGESEVREWRSEQQGVERRLASREENADRRATNLEHRERDLNQKEQEADKARAEIDKLTQQEVEKLEAIANLSVAEAHNELMQRAEEEIKHELAVRYRDMEDTARSEASDTARNILGQAIQRLASDVVSEVTLTNVPLPNDEMKGRLIGREGRNIRAIEKATGVDLIIDETPEAVTLSCFDPIRREVARLSIGKLIADGRIHPARIEEMVAKSEKDLEETIRKMGEETVLDVGVRGMNTEVIHLLGRLKYRFSYGENVLQHSIEVGRLAGMMASEIGANVKIAKTGGLLHDIGKALTHEVEGPHAEIGADVAEKNKVAKNICVTIREHHDDEHSSPESFIVAAADAISAARPGSRRDTVEHYIKRLEALEDVGRAFSGVERVFALQAGREIRVMVQPDSVDDIAASEMARGIVKKIEETLTYPGQIKVTVIRERRSVEYAR
jgi:ribonuclease Y